MKSIGYKFFQNITECYKGKKLIAQFIAFALTCILVISGFDWWWAKNTYLYGRGPILFASVIIGFLLPVFLPLYFLIAGYLRKNFKIKNLAFALIQAEILGWGMSTFYKIFTGRPGPHGFLGNLTDISREFRFGFYRGGAFQGWPSSHTATAFAMSFALIALFPSNSKKEKTIRIIALLYALYIGIGVSTNIHWFSDFVAGAILGSVIGLSVGKAYFSRINRL